MSRARVPGFDLARFLRDHRRLLACRAGWHRAPAWLRPLVGALGAALFLGLELVHRLAFLIDDLLFPGWRDQPVEAPVFIVGVPRSGTTWLHRLLSRDETRFTSMSLAEILYAPAVCQKLVGYGLRALDRALGSPVERLLRRLGDRWDDPFADIHEVDMLEPEEDEMLLLHLWASFHQTLFFPWADEHRDFVEFDARLPPARRAEIMGFYRDMVKKHLYATGRPVRFLSKNPAFSGKLESLAEVFPDAALVITVRSPDAVVPSAASLLARIAEVASLPAADRPGAAERLLATLEHFYHRPLDLGPRLFPGRCLEVRYEALRQDLPGTIAAIDAILGIEPGAAFRAAVEAEASRARGYSSRHEYRLEDFGLTAEGLRTRLASVYARLGYP